MSKSIQEYYDIIVNVKEGKSDLNGLTPLNESSSQFLNDNASGSRLAVWRMWGYIVAVAAWVVDTIFDTHKKEIDDLAASLHYGTLRWYHRISMEFQFGDSLIWNGTSFNYLLADNAKQIIKRAAVSLNKNNVLYFKVATLNSAGDVVKLSVDQLNAFRAYIDEMIYPGTSFMVISQDPDDLKLDMVIYYDALVLNPDGSKIGFTEQFPVSDAIKSFISDLPFNGRLNIQQLIDAIQRVEGVSDVVLNNIEARYGDLPYEPVEREYVAFAGHMALDATGSNIEYVVYD